MPDPTHTLCPAALSTTSFNGRYTKVCGTYDKQDDAAEEHARLWNFSRDEAENYNADMVDGFHSITDGLLVFAALFSVVVTVFVAQTSQALQPDNAQIMVSLLFENNQLLRAAGNGTRLSTVPQAFLGPASQTYTLIDVLVNGLFFTSLVLSLSTAFLTVLANQWIQAYTAFVPGNNKTRALTRHFRFQGIIKWKFGDIIESLPLILHASVAMFLVGLALHVSRLSSPICKVVSAITALTFIFYFGTSILPAFDISCPYRIPFMFSLAQLLLFTFRAMNSAFLYFRCTLTGKPRCVQWPGMSRQSLKVAEQCEVLNKYKGSGVSHHLACDPLGGIFNHSSNHSVQDTAVQQQSGCVGSCAISPPPSATMSNPVTANFSSPTSVCDYSKSAEFLVDIHSSVSTQSSSPNLTSREPSSAPPVSVESSNSGANTSENENGPISAHPSSELEAQPPQLPASTTELTEDGHQILFYVKALYDYTATIEEEFDFREGDIIAVTHTPEDGWWNGELLDEKRRQRGRHVFPSNFVVLCEQNSEALACSL